MLTQRETFPPFIHFYGCRLHFDGRVSEATDPLTTDVVSMPMLKPLEAAVNVARMLVSQPSSSGMKDFLWRVIDSEHRHINEQVGLSFRGFDTVGCSDATWEITLNSDGAVFTW